VTGREGRNCANHTARTANPAAQRQAGMLVVDEPVIGGLAVMSLHMVLAVANVRLSTIRLDIVLFTPARAGSAGAAAATHLCTRKFLNE